MVLYQRPAGIDVQFPMRNADRAVQRRRGNLAEIIVPFVMVRIIVLLIVVRLLQVRAEMGIERNRALAVAPERIDIESHIRINAEIIDFLSEESVVSVGIPMEIILVLSFHTAIEISRVPHRVAFLPITTLMADTMASLAHGCNFINSLFSNFMTRIESAEAVGLI